MEPSQVVLDTDILIDLLRGKKDAEVLISTLERKRFTFFTTAVNVYELHYGAHKSTKKEQSLQATKKLLRRMPILPFTNRAAAKAGHIFAGLEAKGQSIGLSDAFIAAIALTRGYSVVTRNSSHFNKIDGLTVISPQKT
ncbi:MAG: type II toxin-antitoxin system VapC family toxin [Candidatus Bathyarchaeota archaeon]|nr:type II toxin-antitoxin system VapC family toxin [Candidatus Bathyarchaeota archaeon]